MQTATADVTAVVYDSSGRFVAGASVTSSAGGATTNASGRAVLPVPVGSEQVVRIEKDGFAEQVKVVQLAADATTGQVLAMLIAREPAVDIATIEAGGSATGKDGVKVTFPAGALVDSAGNAATGTIQMRMTPVDVASFDVEAFPGVFDGIPTGASRQLIASFGVAELVPEKDGHKLQLAAGHSAEIEVPLYVALRQDGATVAAGETIPLWSLDPATGVWIQEGEGTIVTSAEAPTGLALRATIGHFSWWNLDQPSSRETVNLTVTIPGQTVPAGQQANVSAAVVAGTGPSWARTVSVPVGTPTALRVVAPSTTRLDIRADLPDSVCIGSATVTAMPDTSADVALALDCVTVPVPRIVAPTGPVATNSQRDLAVLVFVDGPAPDTLELLAEDVTTQTFEESQFFYRFFWDSRSASEGTHLLTARATLLGASRDSDPLPVIVDRTPPQLTAMTPSPGAEIDRTTTITVSFNEPVGALPPRPLRDAVKLAVTPIGSSTPQEVPLTFLPGSDPTQIAVQPASALPLGTVSFTWGGVVDAATNPVTGTVTATFAVDRSQILDFVASPAVVQMPMAIDGSGRVVVAWRDDSNQINVARRDGEAWTPFGAPADNPAGSAFTFAQPIRWTVGVDADERPWIVLTRADTADTDRYHVRRFDGTSWQDVGDPFPGRRFGDSGVNPAILFDAQGRPVIAFLRSSSLDVFRFDATSAAWTSLGSASAGLTNLPGPFRFARLDDGSLVAAILGGFGGSNAASLFVSRNPSPESGTTWSLVGPAIDSVPNATQFIRNEIGLAGGPGGPWVTYVKGADRQILAAPLVRFDGNAWVPTAIPPPATNLPVVFIDVAIQDGVPLVVYQASDSNVRVRRLVDGAFEDAFDATPPGRRVEELSVVARGSAAFVAATSQSSEHGFTVERLLFP